MPLTSFLGTVLSYPEYFFDFLFLRALAPYRAMGTVSADLFVFSAIGVVLGVTVGLLGRRAGSLLEEDDANPGLSHLAPIGNVLRIYAVIIGGSLILHGLMRLYSQLVAPVAIGSLPDTLNAALAYSAVYIPLNAIFARAWGRATSMSKTDETVARRVRPVKIVTVAFQVGFPFYFLFAMSDLYGISLAETIRPALVSALGTVVAVTSVGAMILLVLRGNPPVKG